MRGAQSIFLCALLFTIAGCSSTTSHKERQSAATWRVREGTRFYRLEAGAPALSSATRDGVRDWFGAPDWGLLVRDAEEKPRTLEIDSGGSTYLECVAGGVVQCSLIERDPDGYELVAGPEPVRVDGGSQTLRFAEGSTVQVAVTPFDPEQRSGADRASAGAQALRMGRGAVDRVSFTDQDRTDHFRLIGSATGPLVGMLVTQASFDVGVEVDGVPRRFGNRYTEHGLHALELGGATDDVVVRVLSRRGSQGGAYVLLLRPLAPREDPTEALVTLLFELHAQGLLDPVDADHLSALTLCAELDRRRVRAVLEREVEAGAAQRAALAQDLQARLAALD